MFLRHRYQSASSDPLVKNSNGRHPCGDDVWNDVVPFPPSASEVVVPALSVRVVVDTVSQLCAVETATGCCG